MLLALLQLGLFAAKALIIVLFILIILVAFFALLAKAKHKPKGKLLVKNLNDHYAETTEAILTETLSKKEFKLFQKEKKAKDKAEKAADTPRKKMYVINFHGDMKASAVTTLSQEVTAILNVATPEDEVLVRVESPGGVVHGYGLAAAQLLRIRAQNIPLTVTIDKVAASGGYLMACVANRILAAPFAIVGSIGVVVQLPNFHRVLKDNHIDFEMHTAGEFKRTITLFGENTKEGKEKLQEEIEDIHTLFKNLIAEHRQQVDIQQVATGEYWLGRQALTLKLVDEIRTSDDYILQRSKHAAVYEISYEVKKSLLNRLSATAGLLKEKCMGLVLPT